MLFLGGISLFKKILGLFSGQQVSAQTSLALPEQVKQIIDSEIFDLLWFGDGPYQNHQREGEVTKYRHGPLVFTISYYGIDEPSAIYTKLPIINSPNVEKLGYYPSYQGLTPAQRFQYLEWLLNPYEPIDIGYVFIFYYGLERHLVAGNFDKAFETILRLRKVHRNKSFLSYSQNALILSSILHKRPDKLRQVFESLENDEIKGSMPVFLLGNLLFDLKLSVDEILFLAKSVGFTNDRYIKKEGDLFRNFLRSVLIELYKEPSLDLSFLKSAKPPITKVNFLANYSIDSEKRYIPIPDLTQDNNFREIVYSVLAGTHEMVKTALKEGRKKGNQQIKPV